MKRDSRAHYVLIITSYHWCPWCNRTNVRGSPTVRAWNFVGNNLGFWGKKFCISVPSPQLCNTDMTALRNHYWVFPFDALNRGIVRTKHLKLCIEVINAPENYCMKYFVHENGHKRSDAGRVTLRLRNFFFLYAHDVITILNAAPCRYSEMWNFKKSGPRTFCIEWLFPVGQNEVAVDLI